MAFLIRSFFVGLSILAMASCTPAASMTHQRLKNVPECGGDAARDIALDELPAWAIERGSFAAWVGEDIVLAGGTPPRIHVALIDGVTGRIRGIAVEPIDLPGPPSSWQAYFALTGNRLVSLWHSYSASNLRGVIVDLESGGVIQLPQESSPPNKILATSPYMTATTPDAFVIFPYAMGNSVNLDTAMVLDTRSGSWSTISTQLGARLAPRVAALADGRVVVWGGLANRESKLVLEPGAVINVEERSVRPLPYPRVKHGFFAAARHDSQVVIASSTEPFLEGFVLDVDSGKRVTMPGVKLEKSFRNHTVSHFDGKFFLYVAEDALWVFDVANQKWNSHLMPFDPNAPSQLAVHELDVGRVLFTGSSLGDYIFHAREGKFCSVRRSDNLVAPVHVLVSPKNRAILGSVFTTGGGAPDCPPGAPCAIEEVRRVQDFRAVITTLP